MTPPVIYRKDEAAQILKCKVSWLEKKAASRAIPVRMIGGEYAWTPEDLHAIAETCLVQMRVSQTAKPRRALRAAPSPPGGFRPLKAREPRRSA